VFKAETRDALAIAAFMARKNAGDTLSRRIQELFGLDLPRGPRRVFSHDVALIGVAPGTWLATAEGQANSFATTLAQKISDLASVTDQSDGYVVLRLSGAKVRDTLAKLVPVDIHPRAFNVGDVAVTAAAHIGVTLWRVPNENESTPVFEVAFPRSMSESFRRALTHSAAEFSTS
jgi:heterotetrameric sarcosine oxidase gamma subunit